MYQTDLIRSYTQCIKRIDLGAVKPYTETEIQPIYSDIWLDFLKKHIISINPDTITESQFLNVSVIRSMMIMDLFDTNFAIINKNMATDIFNWYCNVLTQLYKSDIFSLEYNIPNNLLPYADYHEDATYFNFESNIDAIKFLNKCFSKCYEKFGDIYADNGYEILGPLQYKNKYIQIHRFKNISSTSIIEIVFYGSASGGIIDMFGHSDIQFGNDLMISIKLDDNYIIEKVELNDIILDNCNMKSRMEQNIESRFMRYQKLINNDAIFNAYYEQIMSKIKLSILQPRVTDTNELINYLNFKNND